jgi:O-antigen/teichoic acid export membrane protein
VTSRDVLSAGELQNRTARGITWSTFAVAGSLPLAIAVSIVLARTLGPSEFARFAYLSFVVPLTLSVAELGFAPAVIRAASRSFANGDVETTRAILSKAVGWNLLRLPATCGLALLVVRPNVWQGVVMTLTIGTMLLAAGAVFSLQAENRGAVTARLGLIQTVTSSGAAILTALWTDSGTSVWILSTAGGLFVVPGWILATNPTLRRAALTPRLPRDLPDGFWRYGLSALLLATVSLLVFSRSEVLILNELGDEKALAVFALAFGLSQRLTTPVDTVLTPLIPALSAVASAHPARLGAALGRALRLSVTAVAFLAASAVVATALAAPIMFGSEYEGTGLVFVALAVVSLVQSAAQPCVAVVHALGRLGVLIRAYIFALVVDVALAVWLIPPLQVWGAVIANVVGGLLAVGLTVRATRLIHGVQSADIAFARVGGVTATAVAAAWASGSAVTSWSAPVGAAVALMVGGGSFVGMGKLVGGLLPIADAEVILAVLPERAARAVRYLLPVR